MKFRFVEQVSMATNNQNNHKQQQQSRPNLETKVHSKTTIQPKNKQDKESREIDNNTKKLFTQFGPTWPTMGERLISPIHYQWVLTKVIQMSYKKLASTSSQRTTLISTYFSNLTNEQDTQWFSLTKVFTIVSQL